MSCASNGSFRLGEFNVHPDKNKLTVEHKEIKLEPKVMAVLCYLADNHDNVISVDELILQVWQGAVVSNQSVQRCISLLRKSFNSSSTDEPYIANFSKKGYQLLHTPLRVTHEDVPVKVTHAEKGVNKSVVGYGVIAISLLMVLVSFSIFYQATETTPPADVRLFTKITPLTSIVGYEYSAEPHPNGSHVVYVENNGANFDLVITDQSANKWLVATSSYPWENLTWSVSGKELIASFYAQKNVQLFQFTINLTTQKTHHIKVDMTELKYNILSLNWITNDELLLTVPNTYPNENYQFSTYSLTLSDRQLRKHNSKENIFLISKYENLFAYVSIHNKRAAIQVFSKSKQEKTLITQWLDRDVPKDISWLPDGSGLLLLENNNMRILYLDKREQALNYLTENTLYRPRFSPNGKKIYVTQQKENHDIWNITHQGKQILQSNSTYIDRDAKYSNSGERFIFISNRSGADQVWLNENNKEQQLSYLKNNQKIEFIYWDQEQSNVLIKLAQNTLQLSIKNHQETIIDESPHNYPLNFSSITKDYLYINAEKQRSLWSTNLHNPHNKRMLITDLGLTLSLDDTVYFQYINKLGLWSMNNNRIKLISNNIPVNSFFIMADHQGVYFYDHDWFYLEFATNKRSTVFADGVFEGWVSDIHPASGWLLNKTAANEKDIVMLQLK